jgi:hypothetical protein
MVRGMLPIIYKNNVVTTSHERDISKVSIILTLFSSTEYL